jgi:hypothetical protein
MIDDGGAHWLRLSFSGSQMHQESWASVDFDNCAALLGKRA